MEFAKNDLCYLTRSKRSASISFTFLRTNLPRHHTAIDLRNRSVDLAHRCRLILEGPNIAPKSPRRRARISARRGRRSYHLSMRSSISDPHWPPKCNRAGNIPLLTDSVVSVIRIDPLSLYAISVPAVAKVFACSARYWHPAKRSGQFRHAGSSLFERSERFPT